MNNEYINNKGLDNSYYKYYILTYLENFEKASRNDINKLLYPKLPVNMNDKNKNNRVRYLLTMLKKENKIENIGSDSNPTWILKK